MRLKILLLAIAGLLPGLFSPLRAAQTGQMLYINRGTTQTVDGKSLPVIVYNTGPVFSPVNAAVRSSLSDTLTLRIINNDSVPHQPWLRYGTETGILQPGDTGVLVYRSTGKAALSLLTDKIDFPRYAYLGLATQVYCLPNGDKAYNWVLHEHELGLSQRLLADRNKTLDRSTYSPDYYTINLKSYPDLQKDTAAMVTGKVGEKLYILVTNAGLSMHAIHFHGYHLKVVFAQGGKLVKDREKDTFPFETGENAILELIPDKPGEYPVHDHNLIAVTGGGLYPNGMMMHLMIK